MMKVKFTNPSSGGIAHMGRPRVEIPGHGEVVIDFTCSDEKTENVLGFLKMRYPALKIEKVVEGEAKTEDDKSPVDTSKAPAGEVEKLALEAFTAAAVVTEKPAGWNEVAVEGVGTFKVRNADGKTPVETAYAEYLAG